MVALMASVYASAQDTIRFRNGRVEAAKVAEVGLGKVKYKKFNNPDGPLFLLDEAEVESIKYQNGDVEDFNLPDQMSQMPQEYVAPVREKRMILQAGPVMFERRVKMNPASYPLTRRRDSPSGLAFDSRYLTEQEAYDLLGHNYDVFVENERRFRTGRVMWITGAALAFISGPIAIAAAINDSPTDRFVSLSCLCGGVVLVPAGIARFSSGKARMKKVIKEYNLEHNARFQNSAELRFGVTGNGVGFNLAF